MLENPFLTYGRITAEDDICLDQLRSIRTISKKEANYRKRKSVITILAHSYSAVPPWPMLLPVPYTRAPSIL